MSATARIFSPVWLQDGKCPGDKRHFHGAAREVYGYLKYHAQRHGGFIFASVPDITKHTKQWADKNQKSFSQRQCERILRAFRDLGILQPGCVRRIHGRKYRGWQFVEHEHWTCESGGLCDFSRWQHYEASSAYIMNEGLHCGCDCIAHRSSSPLAGQIEKYIWARLPSLVRTIESDFLVRFLQESSKSLAVPFTLRTDQPRSAFSSLVELAASRKRFMSSFPAPFE
jgi:hypothetical protein